MAHLRFALLALIVAMLGLPACSRRTPPVAAAPPPPAETTAETPPPPPPPPPEMPPAPAAALTDDELFARKTLDELNAERPLGDVYFDYDQWTLSDEGRNTLTANAAWLRRWPSTRVTIEGHADDRGTSEYNLALGERRATAVREYLVSLGIAGDRLLAVSKGEETPVCTDMSETCWRQNRRGHHIITAK